MFEKNGLETNGHELNRAAILDAELTDQFIADQELIVEVDARKSGGCKSFAAALFLEMGTIDVRIDEDGFPLLGFEFKGEIHFMK